MPFPTQAPCLATARQDDYLLLIRLQPWLQHRKMAFFAKSGSPMRRSYMRHQFDLFAPSPAGEEQAELRPARSRPGKMSSIDEAEMVKRLNDSGRYRILQRLDPPPTVPDADRVAFPRLGVVVDTETTGLNPAQEEIIEI